MLNFPTSHAFVWNSELYWCIFHGTRFDSTSIRWHAGQGSLLFFLAVWLVPTCEVLSTFAFAPTQEVTIRRFTLNILVLRCEPQCHNCGHRYADTRRLEIIFARMIINKHKPYGHDERAYPLAYKQRSKVRVVFFIRTRLSIVHGQPL